MNKKLKGTGDTGLTSHDEEQKVTATVEGGRASERAWAAPGAAMLLSTFLLLGEMGRLHQVGFREGHAQFAAETRPRVGILRE